MRAKVRIGTRPGFVRIIGGQWRRHRIAVLPGTGLRPTPDRVRETLFNWLAPLLPGTDCLDLFAGTGVLGLEALSRGARHAVLVESDAQAALAIETHASLLQAEAEVVRADVARYLLAARTNPFDVVFVDPPYATPVEPVLAALSPWLRAGARVYLERSRSDTWPEADGYEWLRRGTAGAAAYGLARYTPAEV
jgi:16S rRNA (guanine966-N2)-methyltransferase